MTYGELTGAFTTLVTNRIFMRTIVDEDTPAIKNLLQDVDVMRPFGGPLSDEDVLLWIDNAKSRLTTDNFSYLYMSDRFSGKLVGLGGPIIESINDIKRVGVGFIIAKEYWQTTHAIEALSSICSSLMKGYGVRNIMMCLKSDDYRSITTAQKVGMIPEYHLLRNINNQSVEHVLYSINQGGLKDQPVFFNDN